MSLPTTSPNIEHVDIEVFDDIGGRRSFSLDSGGMIMAGSSPGCGIHLDDAGVDSMHCSLKLDEGELWVQDWCTKEGTWVNGSKVQEEAQINPGSEVTIGRYRFAFRARCADPSSDTQSEIDASQASGVDEAGQVDTPAEEITGTTDPAMEEAASIASTEGIDADRLRAAFLSTEPKVNELIESAETEAAVSTSTLATQLTSAQQTNLVDELSSFASSTASPPAPRAPLPPVEVDPEMVALMKAEIECLQSELAERDRQLTELMGNESESPTAADVISNDETEALVGRLERLLEELASSDQRMRALEELLLAEQEVVRHQEDEKAQIENWINDFEQRLSEREGEWIAERNVLLERAEHHKTERDKAESQLHQLNQGVKSVQEEAAAKAAAAAAKALREELDTVRGQLGDAKAQNADLTSKLEKAQSEGSAEATKQAVEDAVREERLALSQERAALSRERSELAHLKATMEPEAALPTSQPTAEEEKFQAFKQTLRELHEQDRAKQSGKLGLGQRISDLWKRLDGPTDTD